MRSISQHRIFDQSQAIMTDHNLEQQKQAWTEEQLVLKQRLIEHDLVQWDLSSPVQRSSLENLESSLTQATPSTQKRLQRVAGLDISFVEGSTIDACACLVVLSFPELELLYEAFTYVALSVPYISGFLAFREVPALEKLYQDLLTRCPDLAPDIALVDGNGILHPHGFGLASHFGVLMNIPSIGVGKTFLHVDGLTKSDIKQLRTTKEQQQLEDSITQVDVHHQTGFHALPLKGESGRIWGAAFWGAPNIKNPTFVSIGNQLGLTTCLQVVAACCRYRVPEPIRQADLRSREVIRQWQTQGRIDEALDVWHRVAKD